EYFRARRVSAAAPGGKNVRWSRSAQVRQRAPRSPARKTMAWRPRSSPQSSQRDSRLEMKTRRSREARSTAARSELTDSSLDLVATMHDMISDGVATEAVTALAPILTPHGRLLLEPVDDAAALSSDLAHRLRTAFARGSGHGLLQLGAAEVGTMLPPAFAYWREFGARYVSAMCGQQDLGTSRSHPIIAPPPLDELEKLAAAVPPMVGVEYLTPTVLEALWHELGAAFQFELVESKTSVQDFLRCKSPAWHVVGRVHFNLAENRLDAEAPFAFLASYTARLSGHAKAQHLPLGRALTEYAGAANRSRLLSLLLPVQRAAAQCAWLKSMVDSGEIFHPLRWTPAEAYRLLADLPRLEAAGVIVRVPGTWRANRPPRPQVSALVGAKPPSGLGTDALLDFRMDVTLDGERLTAAEIDKLLAAS